MYGGKIMKVLLVNGSPHEKGCTYTALSVVAETLNKEGIETEIFHIGAEPISGCRGCGACRKQKLGKCVVDDIVNVFGEKAKEADGFVFGSPVHYASAAGSLLAFMDRFFYSAGKDTLRLKPAAAVASARRAGTTATLDILNKYFTISEMPVVSSRYWNMVHGSRPEDVYMDEEGMAVMRTLGRNMAFLLKALEAAKSAGIEFPEQEPNVRTNFIR